MRFRQPRAVTNDYDLGEFLITNDYDLGEFLITNDYDLGEFLITRCAFVNPGPSRGGTSAWHKPRQCGRTAYPTLTGQVPCGTFTLAGLNNHPHCDDAERTLPVCVSKPKNTGCAEIIAVIIAEIIAEIVVRGTRPDEDTPRPAGARVERRRADEAVPNDALRAATCHGWLCLLRAATCHGWLCLLHRCARGEATEGTQDRGDAPRVQARR